MPNIKVHELVDEFAQSSDYRRKLVFCIDQNAFYLWNDDGYYRLVPEREMKKKIFEFTKYKYPNINITPGYISDALSLMKISPLREVEDTEKNYISFKDVRLNLTTFNTEEITDQKVVTYYMPFNFSDISEVETPLFFKFLNTSIVDINGETDHDLISLIQEMFGYYLISNLKGAAMFFLVGEGANGKSVMASIIEEMIGTEYTSHMSIQDLTMDKFALPGIINKKINISNEEESKYMKSDKFKALVTGERIKGEYKFGDTFSLKPTTKYLFATNELPTFDGLNYGLKRRIKIIPFFRKFHDKEQDKNLLEKIKKEMPGIVGWAIDGAKRFIENNYTFSRASSSDMALREFESEISSAIRFINEEYTVDNNAFTSSNDIYSEYKDWCAFHNKKPLASFRFHKDVNANVEGVKSVKNGGKRGKNLIKVNHDFNLDFNEE